MTTYSLPCCFLHFKNQTNNCKRVVIEQRWLIDIYYATAYNKMQPFAQKFFKLFYLLVLIGQIVYQFYFISHK